MKHARVAPIASLTFFLLFAACGPEETAKKSDVEKIKGADILFLKNPGEAGPELERRLAESVVVQDGLVIVHDPIMGKYVSHYLPTTTTWVMSCGIGLSIVFGSSVSGDNSGTSNDVQITLANGLIEQKDCAVLGPRLGKWLKATLQGEQVSH
jgi:hypothetical protein